MICYGKAAIAAAEKHLGRVMRPEERRACYLEGFADEVYLDSKKIPTFGMGQTGEWIEKGLEAALKYHFNRVAERLPQFVFYPEFLRCELFQAEWRGDLGNSPVASGLIRGREYSEAAKEFLDNAEYRSAPDSIQRRMEAVATALHLYDLTREM